MPTYDWRELRRWNIGEERLPVGSVIKYRLPTVWERHRFVIVTGGSVLVVQALLITGLVLNLRRRRKAERSLRESEERMKLAADAAVLRMWEWDVLDGRVWVTGPLSERIGPTDRDHAQFNELFRTVHPDDQEQVSAVLKKSLEAGGDFEIVHRRLFSDGRIIWLTTRGRVELDERRRPLRVRGVSMDITGHKLAAEQAKKAEAEAQRSQEELAHVSRVSILGELTGSLAHELNQPLTAIVSNAAAARFLMDGKQRNDEGIRDALTEITEEGRRAGEIIAGMRAMLRKDPGQMVTQDVNLAVREVLEMVHSDLVSRHVTPVLRLDPLLPPVEAHSVQLRQVLLNLVLNACDALSGVTGGQRQLTIESRRIAADEVEVLVTDNGPGFSEEILQHLFEPFHTTKPKGLGLGLAICRSIIAAHGGQLVAANENGRGATVRLTLPTHNDIIV